MNPSLHHKTRQKSTVFPSNTVAILNLLAFLRYRIRASGLGEGSPQQAIEISRQLESLLAPMTRPKAMAEIRALGKQAALPQKSTQWSHAYYLRADSHIEHLMEQNQLPEARQAAQALLQHCLAAPSLQEMASVHAYDTAMACFTLARTLNVSGEAETALELLAEAQQRFNALAHNGDQDAARMVPACLTETGDCLMFTGRLEAAAQAYKEAISLDEKYGDQRSLAIGKLNLGTVRLGQQQYLDALNAYREAIDFFNALDEPGTVAIAW